MLWHLSSYAKGCLEKQKLESKPFRVGQRVNSVHSSCRGGRQGRPPWLTVPTTASSCRLRWPPSCLSSTWQMKLRSRILELPIYAVFMHLRKHTRWTQPQVGGVFGSLRRICYTDLKWRSRDKYLPRMIPDKFRDFIRSSMRKISEMAKIPKNRKRWLRYIRLLLYYIMS